MKLLFVIMAAIVGLSSAAAPPNIVAPREVVVDGIVKRDCPGTCVCLDGSCNSCICPHN
ncbi:hypothetical protein LY78DRAFT_74340 [Colletotrichum sublineola]|nr:hypothetical protein LY78DRAFT_74340 [Colletotrichum sublineola]